MRHMKYVKARGAEVPAIGFGTWMMQGEECRHAVSSAISLGYRHIDTAQAYENESEVGAAIEESGKRDEIFLTTKIWIENLTYARTKSSFQESLKKLRTNYVDLLLIHWPAPGMQLEGTLKAMRELQKQGSVRHIGVSNFTLKDLKKTIKLASIVTDQVEYHPLLSQDLILDFLRKHDMFLTAYSPLARGGLDDEDQIKSIASRHQKTVAQVVLRWLIQQEAVVAIPKAVHRKHQEENISIFDFELSEDEMDAIFMSQRGSRLISPAYAPVWDEVA